MSNRARAGYAIGSVGTGGFGTLPGLVLGYYLTDSLGVAAGLAGLVVTVPKIWDVVIDPFIGRLSDATQARLGSRRRLMVLGALTLPIAFVLLFAVPDGVHGAVAAAWVVLAFLAATTAFSLFQVPYIALPAELADGPRARTAFVAPRIAVLALAILAFGGGAPVIRTAFADDRTGYLVMALAAALVMGIALTVSALLTTPVSRPRAAKPAGAAATTGALAEAWGVLRASAPMRHLLGSFLLMSLATGAMLAGAPYLATYTLGNPGAEAILFVAVMAPALLVMPLARRLADRVGKRRALRISLLVFAAGTLSLLFALVVPGPWVFASMAIAGAGYAGIQLYPLSMLPDVIEDDAARTGHARGGVVAGVWTAGETSGLALGPAVALALLAVTGFRSRVGGEVLDQPASAQVGVVAMMSVLPAVLVLLSLIPLRGYRLADGEALAEPGAVAAAVDPAAARDPEEGYPR